MKETGEMSCWSGCTAINGGGLPLIFYTAVFENDLPYAIPFEQRAAIGDDDLVMWERSRSNPILSPGTHGGPDFNLDWRDPFIFRADGRTFMIIGACGESGTPIFEACDAGLTEWRYRGIMWDKSVECPNFIQIGGKWVFISSPFDSVRYDVGSFDTETLTFTPEGGGIVDHGHYYGTNTVCDGRGRCILLGWVPGWDWNAIKRGRGWNGCMALPRVLSLSPDGKLLQQPVPELQKLRMNDQYFRAGGIMLNDSSHAISKARGDMLEIIAEFSTVEAAACGLRVRRSDGGKNAIAITYDGEKRCIDAAGTEVPLPEMQNEEILKLRVFLDRSVMEVYVNDGAAVVTRTIDADQNDLGIEVFGCGGKVELKSLDIWKLAPASMEGPP
jgi:beta-fructofuranosidase